MLLLSSSCKPTEILSKQQEKYEDKINQDNDAKHKQNDKTISIKCNA
jgi:hypothetical protein